MISALAPIQRARNWRPPPVARPWSEFARTIKLPDGPHKGEYWNPETEPHQHYWIAELENGRWRVRVVVAPSQRGKSLSAILVPCLRTLCEEREACAYVMPNLDKLAQNWEGKIRPAIDGAGFGAWLPTSGPGSRGGKAPAQTLRDPATGQRAGTLYFMASGGGGKETSLSSVTVKRPLVDEADDFESEGHILLALKRNESYGDDGEAIIASTVNDRGEREGHPILSLYGRGTRTRLWFRCPLCAGRGPTAGFQALDWSRVTMDPASADTARSSARYVCQHCAGTWDESARHLALRNFRGVHHGQTVNEAGDVTGPAPVTTWLTILSNGLEYHMGSLPKMAADYWAAQVAIDQRADHSAMRLFYYKVLCQDYTGDKSLDEVATQISLEHLLFRSGLSTWGPTISDTDREHDSERRTYSRHVAPWPREAPFGIVTVDVQGDRCYWLLMGMDAERRQWDVAWGYEYATPDRQPTNTTQLHGVLDRIEAITRAYCPVRIVKRGVDANFRADDIQAWLLLHPEWSPTYGASAAKAARIVGGGQSVRDFPGILSLRRAQGWKLTQNRHHIDTNPMRMLAQRSFLVRSGEPGSAMLPSGLTTSATDRAYPAHLCGELWDESKGKWVKAKGSSRWDWLDCRVYALALGLYFLADMAREQAQPRAAPEKPDNWNIGTENSNWDIGPGNFN